jgi:hypothetical protein
VIPSHKICTKCKEDLPASAFSTQKNGQYLYPCCKLCKSRSKDSNNSTASRNCAGCSAQSLTGQFPQFRKDKGERYCPNCMEEQKILGKDKPRIWNKIKRKKITKFVEEAKNYPCMDCGRFFPICAMDFDHVRGNKSFNLSSAYKKAGSLKQAQEELNKCDLVCANCHRNRTQKGIQTSKSSEVELPPTEISGYDNWHKNNKSRVSSLRKKRRLEITEFIRFLKHNKECIDCHEIFPYWCLDFDHRDGVPKSINISLIAGKKHWCEERILEEVAKCELRCANCHRIKTVNDKQHLRSNPLSKIKYRTTPLGFRPEIICKKCGELKLKNEFIKRGLICKRCHSKQDSEYRINNNTKILETKRQYRFANRDFINSLRVGVCIDCEVPHETRKLYFTPKPGTDFIDVFKMNTWSKDRIVEKLKGYDLICASCLGKRHVKSSLKIKETLAKNSWGAKTSVGDKT